jgi:hypothetical protein
VLDSSSDIQFFSLLNDASFLKINASDQKLQKIHDWEWLPPLFFFSSTFIIFTDVTSLNHNIFFLDQN